MSYNLFIKNVGIVNYGMKGYKNIWCFLRNGIYFKLKKGSNIFMIKNQIIISTTSEEKRCIKLKVQVKKSCIYVICLLLKCKIMYVLTISKTSYAFRK